MCLSFPLGLVLLVGVPATPGRAQDSKPQEPAAAAAAAPAPAAPVVSDPTSSPVAPDPTGASYYGPGVSTGGALTKQDGKVTPLTELQDIKITKVSLNLLWGLVAGFLVMFMQAGFAFLETGLCRSKNCAHTMAMNFMIYGIGLLGFWICGFAFQMGGMGPIPYWDGPDVLNKMAKFNLFGHEWKVLGLEGFFLAGRDNDVTVLAMFLFQMVFMDTGATIPTGAMAERWKMSSFFLYGFFTPNAIPGHNMAYTVMGTLILAFGWFGFNPGSTLAATDNRFVAIAVHTMLASAAGCIAAVLYMWAVYGKPDPTMGCNGLLAGLVAITAPCAFVNPTAAVIIGAFAGVLVVWGVLFVERILKVDDPVGAVAVHAINGAWGCLSIGLFADGQYGAGWNGVANKTPLGLFYGGGAGQLMAELVGVLTNFVWVFSASVLFFWIVGKLIGNRTTAKGEIEGLDISEMGVKGYSMEDPPFVQVAGEEHIATHGAGVPRTVRESGPSVPAGRG
jgi:ammonia channel protein AmtB